MKPSQHELFAHHGCDLSIFPDGCGYAHSQQLVPICFSAKVEELWPPKHIISYQLQAAHLDILCIASSACINIERTALITTRLQKNNHFSLCICFSALSAFATTVSNSSLLIYLRTPVNSRA